MALIAQNHLQFIIEIGIILYLGIIFLLNLFPMTLSAVLFVALGLGIGFTVLFGIDALYLFLAFGQNEFTHPFGPIALLAVITALAALPMMKDSGVEIGKLKGFIYLIIVAITIFGGLMHRSFLLLWLLGLLIGVFLISKSFRQKSIFTVKRIILMVAAGLAGFGALELLSQVLQMPIFSPLLRILRLETFATPSLNMVINNTTLLGHEPESAYWATSTGFADGYISLPMSLLLLFGLPFPVFFGILVNRKDTIDYMLPGIFGWSYDFGYLTLIMLLIWCASIIFIGLKMLHIYRERRENGDKKYLGREALLIGSLGAFTAQALIGLFLINRSMNGTALLTFIFLSAMVAAHIVLLKKD